ncbi:hypothetical protein GW17_00055527, partial [Ensete ventricosum]
MERRPSGKMPCMPPEWQDVNAVATAVPSPTEDEAGCSSSQQGGLASEELIESVDKLSEEQVKALMGSLKARLKRVKKRRYDRSRSMDAAKRSDGKERKVKTSQVQEEIMRHMSRLTDACNVQGFVYGLIWEKGKLLTGASNGLKDWWQDKVQFDKNGPPVREEVEVGPPHDEQMAVDVTRKRVAEGEPSMSQQIFTCELPQCLHHDYRYGFLDQNSRIRHQFSCLHREGTAQIVDDNELRTNEDGGQYEQFSFYFNHDSYKSQSFSTDTCINWRSSGYSFHGPKPCTG